MMSKYNWSPLASWLEKRSLRAPIFTLAIASMTASPVCVMPPLAQGECSKDQSQRKPAGESQAPAPVGNGTNWGVSLRQPFVDGVNGWDRRIRQKPAAESHSSTPSRDSSNWELQTPVSESQNSDDPQYKQDILLQVASVGIGGSISALSEIHTH